MFTTADKARIELMATELADAAPLDLQLTPLSAITLAGVVQLALRHPQLPPASKLVASRFLAEVEAWLRIIDAPATLAIVREGHDPAHDRPWPGRSGH